MTAPKVASITDVARFFKIGDGKVSTDERNSLSAFAKEWKDVPDESKAELRKGIGDGTLTY